MSAQLIDVDRPNVLPDSRLKRIVTSVGAKWHAWFGWMQPIFCANCGAEGPFVPETSTTFAFYLCTKCEATHGVPAGMMAVPDEVFWERLRQEQVESYGRELTPVELEVVVAADASPLATLIKEGRKL